MLSLLLLNRFTCVLFISPFEDRVLRCWSYLHVRTCWILELIVHCEVAGDEIVVWIEEERYLNALALEDGGDGRKRFRHTAN